MKLTLLRYHATQAIPRQDYVKLLGMKIKPLLAKIAHIRYGIFKITERFLPCLSLMSAPRFYWFPWP